MKIKTEQEIEIKLTPQQIADIFCDMCESEQVEFFNKIAENEKSWAHSMEYQMCCMSTHRYPELTDDARKIMKAIGEYSNER